MEAVFSASSETLWTFRDDLVNYFENWRAPSPAPEELRLLLSTRQYRGFIPGFLPAASVSYMQRDLDTFIDEGDARIVERLRRRYTAGFLYADKLVDIDPLSFIPYTSTRPNGKDLGLRYNLVDSWEVLKRVEPLIRSGCLILAPIPTEQEEDRIELSSPTDSELEDIFRRSDLCIADRASAILSGWPWRSVQAHIDDTSVRELNRRLNLQVYEAMASIDLPIFTEVPVDTFVTIRESEEAFVEWRSDLRMISRHLRQSSGDPGFEAEAQLLFADALIPRAEQIRSMTSRSTALRDAVHQQPIRATLGAIAVGMTAELLHASPAAALITSGSAGISQVLAGLLMRPSLEGSSVVLAQLV